MTKADWDKFKQMNKLFGPTIANMLLEVTFNPTTDKDILNYYKKHYGKEGHRN